MKRLMACVFLLCIAFGLVADDKRQSTTRVTSQGDKRPNMFPLAKGNQWEFEVNANGQTLSIIQEMTEVTTKGDQTLATITSKVNGMDITEEMSIDDKGIYRHAFNNIKLEKPMLVLKYPLAPQKWSDTIKLAGMEIEVKLEMKTPEDVNVPAGTYKKTTPVEIIMSVQGQEIVATNYYAEGAGIVKQDVNLAGNKFTSALKKFTAAK
ncbi:MAG TPA: hypothetical protein PLN21_06455 [Gemmatales bacterium]|nr:hypothetical protein [Gemmatales bacterium]